MWPPSTRPVQLELGHRVQKTAQLCKGAFATVDLSETAVATWNGVRRALFVLSPLVCVDQFDGILC